MVRIERTLALAGATPASASPGTPPAPPAPAKSEEQRREVIRRIAAWSIDHPGEAIDYALVFPRELQRLREAYYDEQKKVVRRTAEGVLALLSEAGGPEAARESHGGGLDAEAHERIRRTRDALLSERGYCPACAREALGLLLSRRP